MSTAKPTGLGIEFANAGAKTAISAGRQATGFIAEIPTHQDHNWLFAQFSAFINHANEQGIAVHDAVTDYPVDAWAKGSDGEVYVSLQTPNVNQDPTTEAAYWSTLASVIGGSSSKGRLVKRLTTSGSLLINEAVDDSVSAYLTNLDIKSGTYLVFCKGAGGGGGSGSDMGSGGGEGGIAYGVVSITTTQAFTIGAGGAVSTAGGNTILGAVTGNGGAGGASVGIGNPYNQAKVPGGTGNFRNGAGGFRGIGSGSESTGGFGGGIGGGVGGTAITGEADGEDGDVGAGGGGNGRFASVNGVGGLGGDGLIEIYEWSN